MKEGERGPFFPKLRVRSKYNNSSPYGKFHRFLFPFSCKFPDLNFASYVLYILIPTWRTQWAWVTCEQSLFTLNHVYRTKNTVPKFLGPRNFCWRHAQFNYNQERPPDFGGEWASILKCTQKTASLYELRLNLGALKCLHYLFYPNCSAFLSTRTIFTRARIPSPKVPARVKILVRHGWNLVRTRYGQVVYTEILSEPNLLFWNLCQFHPSRAKNFL